MNIPIDQIKAVIKLGEMSTKADTRFIYALQLMVAKLEEHDRCPTTEEQLLNENAELKKELAHANWFLYEHEKADAELAEYSEEEIHAVPPKEEEDEPRKANPVEQFFDKFEERYEDPMDAFRLSVPPSFYAMKVWAEEWYQNQRDNKNKTD